MVTSLGTLLLNDHVLKGRWPGWFTGKASDVVGLYAFPVVVVAGAEVARWMWRSRHFAGRDGEATSAAGRPTSRRDPGAVTIHHGLDARSGDVVDHLPAGRWGAAGADRWAVSARGTGAVIATVAAGFASIKLAQPAGDLYQAGLGALRWLPGAMLDVLSGSEPGAPGRAALVRDPTDLLALVALWPAWCAARRRTKAHTRPASTPPERQVAPSRRPAGSRSPAPAHRGAHRPPPAHRLSGGSPPSRRPTASRSPASG